MTQPSYPSSPSYKVLVVEDEGLIAHDISRRLESLGHQVLGCVSTAEQAVEQAAAADLVLMDIHIDGESDGIDAAVEIRSRHRVPVVFVTAHADRATLDRAKLAGPFGYVVKPLGAGALHAAIEMATYKHKMERQLEEREAWYRATLDSAADAVITLDVAGRVRTLNRAAESLTGWTREQAEGRRLAAIAGFVDERTGLDAGDPVAVALLRDAPVTLPPDARLVGSDARLSPGSTDAAAPGLTPADTIARSTAAYDTVRTSGAPATTRSTAASGTTRATASPDLSTPNPSALIRSASNPSASNPSASNPASPNPAAPSRSDLGPSAPLPPAAHPAVTARAGYLDTAVEGAAAPVKSANETLGAVLTLRDVGIRRWEERQLRQSQRMEAAGRLAASVASDYSHLLATIRNQATHLLEQFGEYSPARRAAEEIHQAASAADQLTRRLATFGTRQTAEPQVISLNRILRHLAKLIDSVAKGRVQVAMRLEPGAGQVLVDPALIEQAIMNLVLHACAVSAPAENTTGISAQLALRTKRTQVRHRTHSTEFVALTLEYSMPEPDIDHLFDPALSEDAGLALPVAHSIVQEHGGFLTARPIRPRGEGTSIEMLLPLASGGLAITADWEPAAAPLAVLFVDPREEVRAELHNVFESAGFNLLEAADSDEAAALAELHEGPLDLVIADSIVARNLLEVIRPAHPAIEALRIVDLPEQSPLEIRRPFSSHVLVERVRSLAPARTRSDATIAETTAETAPELTAAATSS